MSSEKNETQTLEGRAKTRNGVKRMIFAVLAIAIEIAVIVVLLTMLHDVAMWIEIVLRIFAVVLCLWIYGKDTTSAMKMPWIILIMAMPLFGVIMYFLVGLNGWTKKMRERYEEIDSKLLPLLSGKDNETIKRLEEKDPAAADISSYLRRQAGYPVWQNTDVEYFDDASKGLEAQLRDMEKAEKLEAD